MSSVGDISLDLNVNTKQFDKQIKNLDKETKKSFGLLSVTVGNIMADMAQRAVASMGHFVTDTINKGSELSELQNVVDSVFTTMSDKVDSFAKSALESYGLNEAAAKKMMGTFGAMSKSFGYSEEQAYSMSAALTGLAGDVASFYNLSVDEAYTKLKSVYTGETESLKELGVVMTQAALDQFALANGFGKTTSAMTEQEKVGLRLAFVQNKLSTASGDFLRTQDQWANQTRILSGQFASLKAELGAGLINVLTPVIRIINKLMSKLVQLASVFKSFTEMITGQKSTASSGAAMTEVADAAESAAESTGDVEDATKGAAKAAAKAQKALMGFDEINKLAPSNAGSDSSSGSSPGSGLSGDAAFGDAIASQSKKAEEAVDKVSGKVNELICLFKEGFKNALGADFEASLERTKVHLSGIKESLKDIFLDTELQEAAKGFSESFMYSLGQVSGSIVSIGQTLAENIIGGLDIALENNKEFIRDRLVGIITSAASALEIVGAFTSTIASIAEVFRGDAAKEITASIISIFSNSALSTVNLMANLGRDALNAITKPFVENEDAIKEALENTLKPISTILKTLSDGVKDTFETMFEVYDSKLKPAFENISNGLSDIMGGVANAYNKHVAPVLATLSDKFDKVWKGSIQPLLDNTLNLIGSLALLISELWDDVLAPFTSWLLSAIASKVMPIIEKIGSVTLAIIDSIAGAISGIIETLDGVITFITGVWQGDWSKAWEGVKKTFMGIINTIKGALQIPDVSVTATLKSKLDSTFTNAKAKWDAFKSKTSTLTANLKNNAGAAFTRLKSKWDAFKTKTSTLTAKLRNKAGSAFTSLKSKWDSFKSKTATFTAKFNDVFTSPLKKVWNAIADKINSAIKTINKIPGVNITGRVPKLAQGGYVKANSPQLAIIGDNKTQGEIVSPEGKMHEVMLSALKSFFGQLKDLGYSQNSAESGDIVIPIYLDGTLLDEVIVTALQRRRMRSGGTA